jgi:murein DD-endopeptidase MepM/ murein hydrolase activator NlpD
MRNILKLPKTLSPIRLRLTARIKMTLSVTLLSLVVAVGFLAFPFLKTDASPEDVINPVTMVVVQQYPAPVEVVSDPELYPEESSLEVIGSDALVRYIYEIDPLSGDASLIEDTTLIELSPTIVVTGTKRHLTTGTYILPSSGRIMSKFGKRSVLGGSSNHKGWDFDGRIGEPAWAAEGGTVIEVDWHDQFGNYVLLEHENGDTSLYAHLSKTLTNVGDVLYQGDVLGEIGKTGQVTGSHLHFEYHPNGGAAANPALVLNEALSKSPEQEIVK